MQTQLEEVRTISIPRCFVTDPNEEDSYQLHCFTDSSLKAYAVVVYVVQGNQVTFVIGKSRLIHIKDNEDLKIPRYNYSAYYYADRDGFKIGERTN